MSCDHCAVASQVGGNDLGAPALTPGWAAGRGSNGNCPNCGRWLHADGSCANCAGDILSGEYPFPEAPPGEVFPTVSVVLLAGEVDVTQPGGLAYLQDRYSKLRAAVPIPDSDADLWFAPLSCGHWLRTDVRPGGREWCTECDGFSEVVWCVQGQTAFYRREADDILLQLNRSPITDEEMERLEAAVTPCGQPGQDIMTYVHLVVYWRDEEESDRQGNSRWSGMADTLQPLPDDERPPAITGLPKDAARYVAGPVVGHGSISWGIPDWLHRAIRGARAEQAEAELAADERGDLATMEDAFAYLQTASLAQPFDRDWRDIYLYVADEVFSWHNVLPEGQSVWDMLGVQPADSLNTHQQDRLDDLRCWLRRQVVRAVRDREEESGQATPPDGKETDDEL